MAKTGIIERERNRQKLVQKYCILRTQYKRAIDQTSSLRERLKIHTDLQKFPRNSSSIRLRNRCQLSGRSRGYYRRFGLSRHFLRELAHQGVFPGVYKSSWLLLIV